MALDFPTPSNTGEIHNENGYRFVWDGSKWQSQQASSAYNSQIVTGNTKAEVVDTGSDGHFKVTTEGTERIRIDSSGRLLVGTTSARTNVYQTTANITPGHQIETNQFSYDGGLSIINCSSVGHSPVLTLGVSKSTAIGSNGLVDDDTIAGIVNFTANNSSNFRTVAQVKAEIDGTPSTTSMPGRLLFSTTSSGNITPTERMRIDSSGNVGIGTNSPSSLLTVEASTGDATATIHAAQNDSGADAQLELETSNDFAESAVAFKDSTGLAGSVRYNHGDNAIRFLGKGNNAEMARMDSSGRLLIGVTSSYAAANADDLQIGDRTASTERGITIGSTAGGGIRFADASSTDAGIIEYSHSSNVMRFYTDATERLQINSTGKATIKGATNGELALKAGSSSGNDTIQFQNSSGSTRGNLTYDTDNNFLLFNVNQSERMRIDSSGRFLVNKSGSPSAGEGSQAPVFIQGKIGSTNNPGMLALARGQSGVEMANGSSLGVVTFTDDSGDDYAQIKGAVDGSSSSTDHPGRITFLTTPDGSSSPTERMRISSSGRIGVANTLGGQDTSSSNLSVYGNSSTATGGIPIGVHTANVSSERYMIVFFNGNGAVGSIRTNGSSTSYNQSSDYRLKENIVGITDGITRVKQLQPVRFNFIADADTTLDGFLAHEAQAVVPEAISGTHNQVQVWEEFEELPIGVSVGDNKLDEDGNTIPEYQGIDQSKLVPLLTAALQEAIGKIETLETQHADLLARVTALEAE